MGNRLESDGFPGQAVVYQDVFLCSTEVCIPVTHTAPPPPPQGLFHLSWTFSSRGS